MSNIASTSDSPMSLVKIQLEGVVDLMRLNVEKMADRGERLEDLDRMALALEMSAASLHETVSHTEKTKIQRRRKKATFAVLILVSVVAVTTATVILIMSIC